MSDRPKTMAESWQRLNDAVASERHASPGSWVAAVVAAVVAVAAIARVIVALA